MKHLNAGEDDNTRRHSKLLNRLDNLEEFNDDNISSSSQNSIKSIFSDDVLKPDKTKKYDNDDWFNELVESSSFKISKHSRSNYSFMDDDETGFSLKDKKKKKKKKDKDKLTNFDKEFEPEMALYRNLLIDQNRFTENLQKEYDMITSAKSSSRGFTKQLTDLIENITEARTLSMQLVEKNVNAKKLIAELTMKQKKELGTGIDDNSLTDFASNYIKQMINERQAIMNGSYGENSVSEYSDNEIDDLLSQSLGDYTTESRSSDADLYLKYENRNITLYAVIEDNDIENYYLEARDENNEIVDDYPMPLRTKISVNRSTNVATDEYGKKFPIIWK